MPGPTNGVTARKPRSSKRIEKKQTEMEKLPATKKVAGTGRQPNGTFAPGNNFGPGNPHARHCARMLTLFRRCVTEQDMVAIIRAMVDNAARGDTSAAKIVFSYVMGKPDTAPNPDQIDRDEWEHYQKDTINLQEMQRVLGSLPAKVGNNIARTALPIMNEACTKELAEQLREGCNIPQESVEPTVDAQEIAVETPPLSNSAAQPTTTNSCSTQHAPSSTSPTPLSNRVSRSTIIDNRPTTIDSRSAHQAPCSTSPAPIPNGSANKSKKNNSKRKASKPQWLQPLAKRLTASGRKKCSTGKNSR